MCDAPMVILSAFRIPSERMAIKGRRTMVIFDENHRHPEKQ
jgi:hypothetical protein